MWPLVQEHIDLFINKVCFLKDCFLVVKVDWSGKRATWSANQPPLKLVYFNKVYENNLNKTLISIE